MTDSTIKLNTNVARKLPQYIAGLAGKNILVLLKKKMKWNL